MQIYSSANASPKIFILYSLTMRKCFAISYSIYAVTVVSIGNLTMIDRQSARDWEHIFKLCFSSYNFLPIK